MGTILQDLHRSFRVLTQKPQFSVVATLTLALGLGANTAIFSVVHGVLLRPLPVSDEDRIVVAWKRDPAANNPLVELSVAEFRDWQAQSQSFESMAAMPTTVFGYGVMLAGRDQAAQLESARVSGQFFSLLGARAALGRVFRESDDRPGAARVVVLSDRTWRETFGADPDIVNKSITLTDASHTVLGVMPPEFQFPSGADVWIPLIAGMSPTMLQNRTAGWLQMVGKLRPDVTAQEAESELNVIIGGLQVRNPNSRSQVQRAAVTPLRQYIFGNVTLALKLLFAATGLLLLIACANVANLVLARAADQRKQFAIQAALGAGRWPIVRQLLTESLVLALLGGVLGVGLAVVVVDLIVSLATQDVPRMSEVRVNLEALGFSLAATLLTAVLCGLAPAMTASRIDINDSLRRGSNKIAGEPTGKSLRSVLVVAQVALTIVLLAGAGLILRSFVNLTQVDLGFDPRNVLTAQLRLSGAKYRTAEARRAFHQRLVEKLQAQPGVMAASAVSIRPLESTVGFDWPFVREGQRPDEAERNPVPNLEIATPSHFQTFGVPIKAGRPFNAQDTEANPPVVIVSESMARGLFGREVNPLGKRLRPRSARPDAPWRTIVGVAGDVRHRELDVVRWGVYVPFLQSTITTNHFAVRTVGDPAAFVGTLRREVAMLDPNQAVTDVSTMQDQVAKQLARPRFIAVLLNWLSILAVLLASIGIYGVMVQSVVQRRTEIGTRIALGAQAWDILRLVTRQALRLVVVGVAAGLVGAFLLTRFIRSLLYGVSENDPLTFVGIVIVLGAVALLACWIPGRQATRVDPIVAMRSD
jgi:putative ABC transport system permease protein